MTPEAVIIGAGPVGALSALLLARRGVSVELIEAHATLTTESHASTFHPSTLDLLAAEGIELTNHPDAVRVKSIQWRDNRGQIRAEVDYRLLDGITRHPFRIHLEQQALLDRLAILLAAEHRISFRPGLTATNVDPTGPSVTVSSEGGRDHTLTAGVIIGCDGSRSAVRAAAGIGFPSSEYPTGAIRAHMTEDLAELMPPNRGEQSLSGLCYFRGKGDGVSTLRMARSTRLIVRTTHHDDDFRRLSEAVANATPWSIDDFSIDRIDNYRLNRGVADCYLARLGPVLILGDAAHVTSTAGGLNMNAGLQDAFALMPVVADWLHGETALESIAEVAALRREYLEHQVIPRSERRVKGLQELDSAALKEHLDDIDHLAADPDAGRRFLIEASLLDMPLTPAGAQLRKAQ